MSDPLPLTAAEGRALEARVADLEKKCAMLSADLEGLKKLADEVRARLEKKGERYF
jgi:hypothetical protein